MPPEPALATQESPRPTRRNGSKITVSVSSRIVVIRIEFSDWGRRSHRQLTLSPDMNRAESLPLHEFLTSVLS